MKVIVVCVDLSLFLWAADGSVGSDGFRQEFGWKHHPGPIRILDWHLARVRDAPLPARGGRVRWAEPACDWHPGVLPHLHEPRWGPSGAGPVCGSVDARTARVPAAAARRTGDARVPRRSRLDPRRVRAAGAPVYRGSDHVGRRARFETRWGLPEGEHGIMGVCVRVCGRLPRVW